MADCYLDHDIAVEVAGLLRMSSHTVATSRDVRLGRATDDEQLLFAAQRRSILVSHNREDFVLLHDAWRRWTSAWGVTQTHAGILIVPQPPTVTNAQIAQALDAFLAGGPSLTNELYRWRPASGWQRRG
jgi:Domain of unknown function (DUF5615)